MCVYSKAIDAGRIAGNDFVAKLEHNCNVTPAMAQAVFSGMTTELLKNLMLGHSVEISGLGVFWVDVKGKVKERKNGAKYIDKGKVRISFTPKTELNRRLNRGDSRCCFRQCGRKRQHDRRRGQCRGRSVARQATLAHGQAVCRRNRSLASV